MKPILADIMYEVRRVPGLTVSALVLQSIPWRPNTQSLIEYIATHCDRDLEYDKHGNPVFMPKDPAKKEEIRAIWKRIDDV